MVVVRLSHWQRRCSITSMFLSASRRTATVLLVLTIFGAARLSAQQSDGTAATSGTSSDAPASGEERLPPSNHMFGVLPNYATVEEGGIISPVTARQTFQMAALGSFDPYVFPFVG